MSNQLENLVGENFEWWPKSQNDGTKGVIQCFMLEPEVPKGAWSAEKTYTSYRLYLVSTTGARFPYEECVITKGRT